MSGPRRTGYPELPVDLVDATGLLGALGGVLSVALPYFLGLVVALGALLLLVGLVRWTGVDPAARHDPRLRRRYWVGFALPAAAWLFLLAHPTAADRFTGVALGVAGLPLWSIARRPMAFGEG